MLYKYETHLHTSEVSKCAVSTGAEMARAHKEAGYTGIFITDHFINGNTTVPANLPWKQRMVLFAKGYESAKEEGDKIGLDVFFGWEYTHMPYAADYLTFNLGLDFLLAHPEINEMPFEEYARLVKASGGILIHAHPYRTADYIKFEPNPQVHLIDGVEVNNIVSNSPNNNNHLAWELARAHPHLIRTSGTDIHSAGNAGLAGMAFPYRIESNQHFVDALRAGEGYLIIDGENTDLEGNRILPNEEACSSSS